MALILLVVHIVLLLLTIFQKIKVGWLLLYSVIFFMYTLIISFSKNRALTKLGIYICILSILSIVYCFCVLNGVNLSILF